MTHRSSHASSVTYTPDELKYLILRRANFSDTKIPIDELEKEHIIKLRKNWEHKCIIIKKDDCKDYEQYLNDKIYELIKSKEKFRQGIKRGILGKSVYLFRKRLSRALSYKSSSKRGGKHTRRKTRKHENTKTQKT